MNLSFLIQQHAENNKLVHDEHKSHEFHFELSNCYNKIIDFHVIYDDVHIVFMEHSVDINYGCNLKCIFVCILIFPCFLLSSCSRYTTMKSIFMCRALFQEPKRFAAEFMFCECFYAKRFYYHLRKQNGEKARKRQEKKVSSRFVRVNNIEKYVLDLPP